MSIHVASNDPATLAILKAFGIDDCITLKLEMSCRHPTKITIETYATKEQMENFATVVEEYNITLEPTKHETPC